MRERISQSEKKRRMILEQARLAFSHHGFEATRMEDIAHDSGVSKQTIYTHFGSKEGLFLSLVEGMCSDYHTVFEHFCELHDGAPEQALIQAMKEIMPRILSEEKMSICRLIYTKNAEYPEIADAHSKCMAEGHAELGAYFETLRDQGVLAFDDAIRAAEDFLALCKGPWFHRCLADVRLKPTAAEIDSHVRHAVTLFFKAYQPK